MCRLEYRKTPIILESTHSVIHARCPISTQPPLLCMMITGSHPAHSSARRSTDKTRANMTSTASNSARSRKLERQDSSDGLPSSFTVCPPPGSSTLQPWLQPHQLSTIFSKHISNAGSSRTQAFVQQDLPAHLFAGLLQRSKTLVLTSKVPDDTLLRN